MKIIKAAKIEQYLHHIRGQHRLDRIYWVYMRIQWGLERINAYT